MIDWWQNLPSNITPYLFKIGTFELRYYGLMYLVAFFTTYLLLVYRNKKENIGHTNSQIQDFFYYTVIFILIGGRLGYVVFYNLSYFIENPLQIIMPFDFSDGMKFKGIAGMSYHGGAIGAIVGALYFCRKYKKNFWKFADFVVPAVPLGYTFGRLGNFLNGELYGRVTESSIGMYFPLAGDGMLRHASQLYEGFGEGILLFIVLWSIRNVKFPTGAFLGLYLIGYGTVRFVVEYFREPDAHLGFVFLNFSMGQILCFFMVLAGILLILYRKYADKKAI